jgi:hypothetical protein
MTEAKELGSNRRKNSSGTKKSMAETLCPPSLIFEICEICGFKFGIWAKTCHAGSRRSTSLLADENNLTLRLDGAAFFFDADRKRICGLDGSRRMETRADESVSGD